MSFTEPSTSPKAAMRTQRLDTLMDIGEGLNAGAESRANYFMLFRLSFVVKGELSISPEDMDSPLRKKRRSYDTYANQNTLCL